MKHRKPKKNKMQFKVLKFLARGWPFKKIAKHLKISEPVVSYHWLNIKKKFGVKDREELLAQITEAGDVKKFLESRTSVTKEPPAFEAVVGAPTTDIDKYRSLPKENAEIAKDIDDVDMASTILRNKILKCGRANGRAEIVRRVIDHAVAEIKMLVSTRE
jgi:DNA-binding CsgD family transcriptional regulator